jgi:cell wall-associated NlpC family hydrolase
VAFRLTRIRTLCITATVVGAAAVIPAVAAAAPAPNHASHPAKHPKPTIDSVQKQLGKLAMRNDQLVEQFNQATSAYSAAKRAAAAADAANRAAQHQLSAASQQLALSAAAQYEGGAFSTTGALLSSESGQSYLDQLDTLSMLSTHNAQVVSSVTAIEKQAQAARHKADRLFAQARAARTKVSKERTATTAQIEKYKQLLSKLNAAQRAAWARASNPTVSQSQISAAHSVSAPSAAARRAVEFALAQVGKPYVFGAAGPSSYDCSGLTMAAWQAGGVSLPHSAADQYNYGHHVSFNELQPGDLLFFYQPIGHVTIYIGDGMMVSAPTEGENVKVVPAQAFGSDFVGATRLVG